jgi:hypothetical protein
MIPQRMLGIHIMDQLPFLITERKINPILACFGFKVILRARFGVFFCQSSQCYDTPLVRKVVYISKTAFFSSKNDLLRSSSGEYPLVVGSTGELRDCTGERATALK